MAHHQEMKKHLPRRDFIKTTAVGVGVTALAGLGSKEAKAALPPQKWDKEVDVVVVGFGAAGAAAAIEAHDGGARVLVLEKGAAPSGATPNSGGTVWLPVNPLQGRPDSVADAIAYLTACARGAADEALIRTFAEHSQQTAEWLLTKIGLKASQPNRYDYHPSYPGAGRGRNFSSQGAGAGLMSTLANAVTTRGIEVRTGIRAKRLVVDANGRVGGVVGEDASAYRATRAVILCAGGFSWNESMKRGYLRAYPFLGQVPGLTGDGILLGMSVGAALESMNEDCGVPLFQIPGTARGAGLPVRTAPSCIMVNRRGERFGNESADYDTVAAYFYAYDTLADAYQNVPAWLIFDEKVRAGGPVSSEPGWSGDNSVEIQRGWIKKADSLEALAALIGAEGARLAQTVTTYNQHAAGGKDPIFHRGEIPGTAGVVPLSGPPFYAIEAYPGLYDTVGGLKTNEKARVVSALGDVIAGLYAAGTNAHMALGFYYPNGGTCIGQALVFGRIAGRNAAAETP